MAKTKKNICLGILFLGVFFLTCNAPRKNPLDPSNTNVDWASLYGTVQSLAVPVQGLSDVIVSWNNKLLTTTDQNGQYIRGAEDLEG